MQTPRYHPKLVVFNRETYVFLGGITITNYFGKHTNWDFLDVQMLQRHKFCAHDCQMDALDSQVQSENGKSSFFERYA